MSTRQQNAAIGREFTHEQGLLPWEAVRDEWNRRSGENITRTRVWQIAMRAQRKMARQLRACLADLGPQR